jgi:integrase
MDQIVAERNLAVAAGAEATQVLGPFLLQKLEERRAVWNYGFERPGRERPLLPENSQNMIVQHSRYTISELLGLKWRHIDLQGGVIQIVQRNWRGDIDDPKSKTSKRPLTLGYLVDRYRVKATADSADPEKWVFVRTDGSGLTLWDSGVRQALKRAAAAEGCDFPGLGPHSFRRANITWRQEVGGSSIEASKIAGHSTVRMTEEYTKIQLTRQEELTRRIQERLASVGEKQPAVLQ